MELTTRAWPSLEPETWEVLDAATRWAGLGLIVLTALLCVLAYVGLKGDADLERRPVRLPRQRGRHAAGNRPPLQAGVRPPRERVEWLGGSDTLGWWIWDQPPPADRQWDGPAARPYVDQPYDQ